MINFSLEDNIYYRNYYKSYNLKNDIYLNSNLVKKNIFNEIVLSLFNNKPANIVQVGTCDGCINDPIFNLIKHKIKTDKLILIEPQRDLNPIIESNYSFHQKKFIINLAVGKPGNKKLFKLKDKYHKLLRRTYLKDAPLYRVPAGFVSASYEHVRRHIYNKLPLDIDIDEAIEEFEIVSVELKTILEKCKLSNIDILQIDTEGFDDEVIYHSNIDIYQPKVVNFEHMHFTKEKKKTLFDYMSLNNYYIKTYSSSDTLAIKKELFI